MSLLGWVLLGLMAGFMASNVVRSSGQGLLLDLVLGIVGAVAICSLPSMRRASPASIFTAPAFKAWLSSISQKVAEASSEGGFLGIGGVQVSDAEKATLGDIAKALGTSA
jgi:uncharacterized membrane protein YeaQ/YmgE (transglycosylase-associated protein family)